MKWISTIVTSFVLILGCTNLNAQVAQGAANADPKTPPVADDHEVETLVNDVLLSIGFNLNLIATTQTSGLYYDVNTFIPSLGGDSKIGKNLGFDLRLNQGAFIPKSYGEMERTSFFRINAVTNENVISILQQDHIDATEKAESYLAVSISPTWKIKDGFPIYLVAHMEFVRKTTDFITTTTISNEENIEIEPERLGEFTLRNRRIVAGERVNTTNDHLFNAGLGFKFYRDVNKVSINLKMVAGRGTNPDLSVIPNDGVDRDKNGFFYLTHFEVSEREFGIKMGGEIRGLFRPDNYNSLHPTAKRGYEPYSNIYIAKVFKFSKISDLIRL